MLCGPPSISHSKLCANFALFCFVTSQWDLMCFMLTSWYLAKALDVSCCALGIFGKLSMFHVVLLVSLESSPWWVEVHRVGLRLFGVTMWKLLIIEPFSQWKLNKIINCIGIWECSWYCWKALGESDLIKFISQFSELRCRRYWFWGGFCY